MQNFNASPRLLRDSNGFESIAFSAVGAALGSVTLSSLAVNALNRNGATPPFVYHSTSVKRWDLRSGVSEAIFQDSRLQLFPVLSKNWSLLASSQQDRSILVWDLRHPQPLPVRFPGHKSPVTSMAFSNDETLLASAGDDLAVRVWNLANPNTEPLTFRGSGYFVKFSLDDSRLLAGGTADLRLWDLREPNAPPLEFKGARAPIRAAAISPDGTRLAYGDSDGNVWLRNLWTAAADYLCTRVSRNLTPDEWRLHVGEIPYERTCPTLPDGTRGPR
jgi:WD40 repeat protein